MAVVNQTPTKIDLACGQSKREGFFGVDIADVEGVDLACDLSKFPWPFEDDSVDEIFASHYVEHTYPVGGPHDGLIAFMNECWRICKEDAKLELIHPYAQSKRAFQDPTHTRYINEITWWYFNLEWREMQKLDHYPITANFAVEGMSNGWYPGWELRSEAARNLHADQSWNIISDLVVNLKAIK